ncbi:MAG: metallophosphoesterase [Muribaculaceae bacterium]|nr:metallophosphoesterase [Muribaculaceae bacterium]
MSIVFSVLVILLILLDSYVIFGIIPAAPLWGKGLFLLPSIAYLLVLGRMFLGGDIRQSMLNWLFWLTLCVFLTTLIFCLFSVLGKGVGLFWQPGSRLFNILGVACAVGWLGISLYGIIFGWKKITVDEVSITSSKIPPSFKGYRIVQLSDFHIGTYHDSPATVDRIVEKVNSLNPDLIVFTGDLVNSSSGEITEFKEILSRLKAKDGIYSVLGNHDYCLYREYTAPDSPEKELAKVISNESEIGWHLLRNESVQIKQGNDSIALAGVDNAGGKRFTNQADLPKAIKGLPEDEFKILLSHDPSHWRREVLPHSDIDLTLSGHTHAMQFKIGKWSPSSWAYPEWGGLYAEENRTLYVSTGIGENIAFRFGAYPQIVLITLD